MSGGGHPLTFVRGRSPDTSWEVLSEKCFGGEKFRSVKSIGGRGLGPYFIDG